MFSKTVFASTAICTTRDRFLEDEINARLAGRGKVSAYTIQEADQIRYGLTYSHGGKHKTFERPRFELDVDSLLEGLEITAGGMENSRLPRGWVYDVEEADEDPFMKDA